MANPHFLTTQAACCDDLGNIWFFSDSHNGLYRFNIASKEVLFITSFYEEIFSSDSLYTKAIYHEKNIFFIPCVAKNIAIYNVENHTTKYIPLTEQIINFNVSMYTPDTYLLFPAVYSNTAYLLDLKTCTLKELPLSFGPWENDFTTSTLLIGNGIIEYCAYFAIYNSNQYIRYDITQNTIQIFTLPIDISLFRVYTHNETLFFLSFDGCNIIKTTASNLSTNPKTMSIIQSSQAPITNAPRAYVQLLFSNCETILALPYNYHDLLINSSNQRFSIPIDWTQTGLLDESFQAYSTSLFFENYFFMLPYGAENILQIDLKTQNIAYIPINTCNTHIQEIFHKYLTQQSHDFLFYEQQLSLTDFISYL